MIDIPLKLCYNSSTKKGECFMTDGFQRKDTIGAQIMFNIHAFLVKSHKTIFNGTMNYLPRIGEEISVNFDVFRVKNIRYVLTNGTVNRTEVLMSLELINYGND